MTTNETPDTGTLPADVAALIRLMKSIDGDLRDPEGTPLTVRRMHDLLQTSADTLRTLASDNERLSQIVTDACNERDEYHDDLVAARARIAELEGQLTQAAKSERAKCVAELRARAKHHSSDIYDRGYYEAAADHIEANGRTATDILHNLDELFESEVADEIDAMTTEEINRDVERSGVNIDNLMSRIRGHIDEANGRDTE